MKYLIPIYILSMYSCSSIWYNSNISKEENIQKYLANNFVGYNNLYDSIVANIELKKTKKVSAISLQLFRNYQIDKLIVFNKNRTKLFTTINTLTRVTDKGSSDRVQSLYGVKIDREWHVYLGANLIAMRDGYKFDKYEPFTWDEISYMAHEQMFGKYIDFDGRGDLVLKPNMVDKYVDPENIGGSNISQEGTDTERFLRLTAFDNSQIIDSLEYQQLLDEVNNPAPKEKEPIDTYTWWNRLMGKKKPIFETDEWKEYIANKNKK